MKYKSIIASFALLVIGLCPGLVSAQGTLTPPGPPGPTMLALSQIQPRTPVDAFHTPGNSSAEFAISNAGSYYLTTNIAGVSGKDGIDIDANNVTLDLNGFSIIGVSGALYGINTTCANIVVHSGIVSQWTNGIYSSGANVTLQSLTVCSNAWFGIEVVGSSSSVIGNNVAGNNTSVSPGYAGILVGGTDNLIQNNHVVATAGSASAIGIFAVGTGSVVVQNIIEGNGGNDVEWGSAVIIGQNINTTSGEIITNSNPWGNLEF